MSGLLPSLESFAKGTAATAAGLSTVGFGLLFFGQNYLIYPSAYPPGSRSDVYVPTDFDLPYQDLPLTTPDGVKLRCYLLTQHKELSNHGAKPIPSPEEESNEEFAARRPTVLMFHGNGGNVGHRIPLAKVFYVKMRCNVLMLSYRGYGLSEGSPSEKGIRIDAQTVLDYVQAHEYLSRTPVILYGQSIGGAVAIDLASRNKQVIRALILENTFLSLPRLVPSALPVLGPFAFLCHQKWDSASKIPLIPAETPMLLLSGVQDEVVPREHMQSLWELVEKRVPGGGKSVPPASAYSSSFSSSLWGSGRAEETPKSAQGGETEEGAEVVKDESVQSPGSKTPSRFIEFVRGTHNDTCMQQGYWQAVAHFMDALQV